MPTVDEVKLSRDLISNSLRKRLAEGVLIRVAAWIKIPEGRGAVQGENSTDVVVEDDVGVEAAGDETTCLEEGVVSFEEEVGEGGAG